MIQSGQRGQREAGKMKKLLDTTVQPGQEDAARHAPEMRGCFEADAAGPADAADQSDSGLGHNPDKNPLIEAALKLRQAGKGDTT